MFFLNYFLYINYVSIVTSMSSLLQTCPSLLNGHSTPLPQLPALPQVNSTEILSTESDVLSWITSEFFINALFIIPIYSLLLAGVLTFVTLRHPLAIGVTLLVCTLAVSALTAYVFPTPWFGFSLFLIIVGGLIVIFVYVSLLSSNETFGFPGGGLVLTSLGSIVLGILIGLTWEPGAIDPGTEVREGAGVPTETPEVPAEPEQFVSLLFSSELGILTLFLVSYLLLSLLVVVFNTKASRSTLRTQK